VKDAAKRLLRLLEKTLNAALGVFWAPVMLFNIWLEGFYLHTRPRAPIGAGDHLYALNIHGTTVYLTLFETFLTTLHSLAADYLRRPHCIAPTRLLNAASVARGNF
jgi:hypothetical protein